MKVKIQFGSAVKQTGVNEITIEAQPLNVPVFTEQLSGAVSKQLGEIATEKLLIELEERITHRLITEQMVTQLITDAPRVSDKF